MLAEQLDKAWRDRRAVVPIDGALRLSASGLVLGAGTVLAPAGASGRDIRIEGQEPRLLALLCAAHLKSVGPEALSHVRKAAERWNEGREGLARVHLALSRLDQLSQPELDSRRLFFADGLINAGVEPEAILKVLDLDLSQFAELTRAYNDAQPRVPKGNGRPSGQWTNVATTGGAAVSPGPAHSAGAHSARSAPRQAFVRPVSQPSPAAQLVRIPNAATGALSAGELAELALFAGRFAGPAAALSILFIPTNKSLKQEGYLPGHPPIRFLWHSDERSLILAGVDAVGIRWTDPLEVGLDGLVRDHKGQVVGRVLPNSVIIIDRDSVGPKDDPERYGPTLCPPASDEGPGRGVAKDRDYEDYVKKLIKPKNPTPRGFSVILRNPQDHGAPVSFDTCHGETGAMIDAKGTGYAKMLSENNHWVLFGNKPGEGVIGGWLDQAERQVQASTDRAIYWYFAEKEAADHAEVLFKNENEGRERIQVVHLPWKEGQKWR